MISRMTKGISGAVPFVVKWHKALVGKTVLIYSRRRRRSKRWWWLVTSWLTGCGLLHLLGVVELLDRHVRGIGWPYIDIWVVEHWGLSAGEGLWYINLRCVRSAVGATDLTLLLWARLTSKDSEQICAIYIRFVSTSGIQWYLCGMLVLNVVRV